MTVWPIALVGMPGAGKSTVGRLLAERLALPFVNIDTRIEREAGLSIAQIFDRDGEVGFRALEYAAIDRLLGDRPLVLAAGGGAMADAKTRALLLTRSISVWLDAPLDMLVSRLAGGLGRPLLAVDPVARLTALKAERDPLYALARIRIDADGTPAAVAAAAADALKAWPDRPSAAPAR